MAAACPVCQKPVHAAHKPFCSGRCKDIDLGRWFLGKYQVPGEDGNALQLEDNEESGSPQSF